jgi:hypothetical protein
VDTVRYGDSGEGVIVNFLFNVASGGTATGDTFIGVENVTGSSFNDLILGDGLGTSATCCAAAPAPIRCAA